MFVDGDTDQWCKPGWLLLLAGQAWNGGKVQGHHRDPTGRCFFLYVVSLVLYYIIQSLYHGHYALLSPSLSPRPDYW